MSQTTTPPTGPTTPEGKAISSKNALKHGLTGSGKVLPPAMQEALDARLADWSESFDPQTPFEAYLVRRMTLASIRLDECSLIAAHLDHNHKIAAQTHPRLDRQIELRNRTTGFNDDPLLTRLQLLRTADGCRWLAQRWRTYQKHYTLDFNTSSILDNYHAIADLLGIRRDRRPGNKALSRLYKNLYTIANPDASPDDHAEARRRVASLARRQIEKLNAAAQSRESLDQLEITRRQNGLTLCTSKEFQLARRYETSAQRDFDRALAQLHRLQSSRPQNQPTESESTTKTRCLATPHLTDALPTSNHDHDTDEEATFRHFYREELKRNPPTPNADPSTFLKELRRARENARNQMRLTQSQT